MTITKNSAKCVHCGVEIESKYRHDFVVHFCPLAPSPRKKWEGDKLVEVPGETDWNFAVDGGHAYLGRSGEGFIGTSEVSQ